MRPTFAFLLAGMLACSDSSVLDPPVSEPDPPREPTPAATLVASYALVLVNGSPLPSESPTGAGQWDYDGVQYVLDMATLAFYKDGTFVESWYHRRKVSGESIAPQNCTGRFTRISDSTLQLGVGEGATLVTLTATGLVWQFAGFTLTYELQK